MKAVFDSYRPPRWPALLIGLLIVASVGFLFLVRVVEWRSQGLAAEHRTRIAALERIVLELTNAETAQRGFLLTAQERYLDRYDGSAAALGAELEAIGPSVPRHRRALDELARLSGEKLAELGQTINLAKAGDFAAAGRIVATGRGKALMDQARARADAIIKVESGAAAEEESRLRRLQVLSLSLTAVVLGSGFAGLLLIVRTVLARQEHATRILRAVLDAAPDPISLRDREGDYVHANLAAQAVVGTTPIVGRKVEALLEPEEAERLRQADLTVLATNQPTVLDIRFKAPEGEARNFSVQLGPLRSLEGETVGVFSIGRDMTELRRHQALQRVMVDELNHRVKNSLATVQSIASQTFRNGDKARYEQFEARLVALSMAHDLLTRTAWSSADLRSVVETALKPIGDGRLELDGPQAELSPKVTLALSLALHELGVNAAKYGAWSTAGGVVGLAWTIDGAMEPPLLSLAWTERGGPPVRPPAVRGFGSRLIERGLAAELGGSARITFDPSGVRCALALPLAPAAQPLVLREEA